MGKNTHSIVIKHMSTKQIKIQGELVVAVDMNIHPYHILG